MTEMIWALMGAVAFYLCQRIWRQFQPPLPDPRLDELEARNAELEWIFDQLAELVGGSMRQQELRDFEEWKAHWRKQGLELGEHDGNDVPLLEKVHG